jgi:hypothetical protein
MIKIKNNSKKKTEKKKLNEEGIKVEKPKI